MLKLKNFKQKVLYWSVEKDHLIHNDRKSSPTSANNIILNENHVTLLTKWLDQLNRQESITVTEQNDMVIMTTGKNDRDKQIFINSDDIDDYMEAKTRSSKKMDEGKLLDTLDVARILLKYGYVDGSSGKLLFNTETIAQDSSELAWLISIVVAAQPDLQSNETHVKLFDGENMQLLRIPYEYMAPTVDTRAVATYLFRNGHVRYDVDTGIYAYRYVEPDLLLDEKNKSTKRAAQRQLLFFQVHQIHIDEENKRVEVEFLHEPIYRLIIPVRWYYKVLAHHFDRNYIVDLLLANGGVINQNTFVFMGRAYSLEIPHVTADTSYLVPSTYLETVNLSSKQKNDLIRRFIDLIIEQDGMKQDDTNRLILLENTADGRQLYFTSEHSQFIRENQFQRQDVIDLLIKYGQIKQDQSGSWFLYYNNQCINFCSNSFHRRQVQ